LRGKEIKFYEDNGSGEEFDVYMTYIRILPRDTRAPQKAAAFLWVGMIP
jgi:hypothetical protein